MTYIGFQLKNARRLMSALYLFVSDASLATRVPPKARHDSLTTQLADTAASAAAPTEDS